MPKRCHQCNNEGHLAANCPEREATYQHVDTVARNRRKKSKRKAKKLKKSDKDCSVVNDKQPSKEDVPKKEEKELRAPI